jgi:hypothetical protein
MCNLSSSFQCSGRRHRRPKYIFAGASLCGRDRSADWSHPPGTAQAETFTNSTSTSEMLLVQTIPFPTVATAATMACTLTGSGYAYEGIPSVSQDGGVFMVSEFYLLCSNVVTNNSIVCSLDVITLPRARLHPAALTRFQRLASSLACSPTWPMISACIARIATTGTCCLPWCLRTGSTRSTWLAASSCLQTVLHRPRSPKALRVAFATWVSALQTALY